jgi:uncharacterized protein (DUF697 family)
VTLANETDRWEFYTDARGRHRWRRSLAGQVISSSNGGFASEEECRENARRNQFEGNPTLLGEDDQWTFYGDKLTRARWRRVDASGVITGRSDQAFDDLASSIENATLCGYRQGAIFEEGLPPMHLGRASAPSHSAETPVAVGTPAEPQSTAAAPTEATRTRVRTAPAQAVVGPNPSATKSANTAAAKNHSGPAQEARYRKARKLVERYATGALCLGLLPLPAMELLVVPSYQISMVRDLSLNYGIKYEKSLAKSLLAALVGVGILAMPGKWLAQLLAGATGMNLFASGMLTGNMVGAANTLLIGRLFTEHFESGGTLLNFNAAEMRAHYQKSLTT